MLKEETSSFFTSPDEPGQGDGPFLEPIHSSENGYCMLYRINRLGRFRVLKCLKPEYRGNPTYEGLLRKEFEIGFGLDHPNICQYYSFRHTGELGNCIEMEWVDGRTLEELLAGGRPGAELQMSVLDQLCDALSYMHSKQVLHRDIKPSNIIVTHKGDVVKVIDFGFSDSDSHSVLKASAGTALYTAPEVLKGAPAGISSDIYSLGLIIAALTGRHRAVVRRCCDPRPARRYSSVADVKKALHSKWPAVSGILFILLVASFALFPYVSGWFSRADVAAEHPEPITVPVDTSVLTPADTLSLDPPSSVAPARHVKSPAKEPAPQVTTPQEEPVDDTVIDELFRQATELFE